MRCTVPHVLPFSLFPPLHSGVKRQQKCWFRFLWEQKQALLINLTQGLNFGPVQSFPFCFFYAVFLNSTFLQRRWNALSSDSWGLACRPVAGAVCSSFWTWHAESLNSEVFLLLCVSKGCYCCCTPPLGDAWRPTPLLNPLLGPTRLMMHHHPLKCITARVTDAK